MMTPSTEGALIRDGWQRVEDEAAYFDLCVFGTSVQRPSPDGFRMHIPLNELSPEIKEPF